MKGQHESTELVTARLMQNKKILLIVPNKTAAPKTQEEAKMNVPNQNFVVTANELLILNQLKRNGKITQLNPRTDATTRQEYDINYHGIDEKGIHFSGWLPLGAIRTLTNWTKPEVADHSEYPEMAMEGDWSSIRDSQPHQIWYIFQKFVLSKLNEYTFNHDQATKLLS